MLRDPEFKVVLKADGRNSVVLALTAKYRHGHQSPEHMKASAEAAGILVGIAYGFRDNSSSEKCLLKAKALSAVNGESINHRADVIVGVCGRTLNSEGE
ncbi:hypothetical protein RvY_12002 [Ramazzottius varieornatus]|uniref:Uncharacterized protein n=1 Tax=Ramazzottius varieornatus TaxID=947166 RepID=A0A1D1VMA3_RAMVA|nr:hypothetical protein RvY_12002 [Ramazzottius varieornatus]